MLQSGEDILADIDITLDQLILNAETISSISLNSLFTDEMQALQKMQESLLARLLHMNDLLEPDEKHTTLRKKPVEMGIIEEKMVTFGKLSARLVNRVKGDWKMAKGATSKQPKIGKNRKRIRIPV